MMGRLFSCRLGWTYFPHCAALSTFLALAASQSPLVHDAYLLYQLTADNCLLSYVVSCGIQLVAWTVLWFTLTATRNWTFVLDVRMIRL